MNVLLNSNQASSQQNRNNNTQDSSNNSESDFKKSKAIESSNAQPIVNKNENQVQNRKTQVEKNTAATSFDSKTQNNKSNNKNKNKQKKSDLLARFRNIQSKSENITSLIFLTELKRIEKCADTNYYNIFEFSTDSNNIDIDIQIYRYIRLTQLMHSDKFEKKFKTRVTKTIQSKRESYKMFNFAEF